MDNKNQNQNKTLSDNKVPKDLLILVNHPDSPIQNNNYNLKKSSDNNKFIKDVSDSTEEKTNSQKKIINTKLNILLGLSTIEGANNLSNSNVSSSKKEVKEKTTVIDNENKSLTNTNISYVNNNSVSGMDLDTLMKNTYNYKIELEQKTTKSNKWFLIAAIGSGICFVIVLMVAIFSGGINFNFRGGEAYYQDKTIEKTSEFQTAVVTDNIYENVTVNNIDDAKALIVKDSTNQKNKCENLKVKEVEKRIEEKYEIVAVNLCELDYKFTLEIEKVLERIYKEFPSTIKGHLTNLTLSNNLDYNVYAAFSPAKLFAKSNTFSTYPNVYKMSITLNAEYFLNSEILSAEVESSAGAYWPKNANGYSLVAHEFGHYLSFVAQLNNTQNMNEVILLTRKNYSNYYNLINVSNEGTFSYKIINEAYENFNQKKPYKYADIQEFRASISEYSIATDENGNPIYDETIAEAFHDWYLNKQKAADASKEIVSVLKKYINN